MARRQGGSMRKREMRRAWNGDSLREPLEVQTPDGPGRLHGPAFPRAGSVRNREDSRVARTAMTALSRYGRVEVEGDADGSRHVYPWREIRDADGGR